MPRKAVKNKHQKAAYRPGEERLGREEIGPYLEMSVSDDAAQRLEAAKHLCPCHVRTRIEDVTTALYRMLEDPDHRVHWAAWHTLEDGGVADDPELEKIILRADGVETDPKVRGFVNQFARPLKRRLLLATDLARKSAYTQNGKCDFCGAFNRPVKQDFFTQIPEGNSDRVALVCKDCDGQQGLNTG